MFSWIAEFIDTSVRVDRAELAEQRQRVNDRNDMVNQLIEESEKKDAALDNLAQKLAEAAKTINTLRDQRKRLREELIVMRQYAIDATEYIEGEMEGLGPRSKKRVVLEATLAAVNADLKKIADLLVETSK